MPLFFEEMKQEQIAPQVVGTARVSFLADFCILFPYLTRYHMTPFSKKKNSIRCGKLSYACND